MQPKPCDPTICRPAALTWFASLECVTSTAGSGIPRCAEEQARFDRTVITMFEEHIAFNKLLGLRIVSVQPGEIGRAHV